MKRNQKRNQVEKIEIQKSLREKKKNAKLTNENQNLDLDLVQNHLKITKNIKKSINLLQNLLPQVQTQVNLLKNHYPRIVKRYL